MRLRGGMPPPRKIPVDFPVTPAWEQPVPYILAHEQRKSFDELFARVLPCEGEEEAKDLPFKVLVYDSHWRDVMSMCIKPSELVLHGVFHKEHLGERNKTSVPYLPAAYFLRSTKACMDLAAEDVEDELYGSYYVHVGGHTTMDHWKPLMEGVSEEVGKLRVKSATDIFVDFISLGGCEIYVFFSMFFVLFWIFFFVVDRM